MRKEYQRKRQELKNIERGGIPCPICGYICVSVGSHLFYAHKIKANIYRRQSSLKMNHVLTSPVYHSQRVLHGKKQIKKRSRQELILLGYKMGKMDKKNCYFSNEEREELKQRWEKNKEKILYNFSLCDRSSEAAKKRIKKYGHPAQGREVSKETRIKLSLALKRFHAKSRIPQ